jgi:hypothetical protein
LSARWHSSFGTGEPGIEWDRSQHFRGRTDGAKKAADRRARKLMCRYSQSVFWNNEMPEGRHCPLALLSSAEPIADLYAKLCRNADSFQS